MAKSPKTKRSRSEIEIEKYRIECQWLKIKDIINGSLKNNGSYMVMVSAEAAIELFLSIKSLTTFSSNVTNSNLIEAERKLKNVIASVSLEEDQIRFESSFLLSKLLFMQQEFQEALNVLDSVYLEKLKISAPLSRFTKLLAEAFAVKGMCLERLGGSRDSMSKALTCFERAGDLCLMHLQQLEQNSLSGGVSEAVEIALQRSPIISVELGQVSAAVTQFRNLLRVCESPAWRGLRQTLARQLAEVLLRGVCRNSYERVFSDIRGTSSNIPGEVVVVRYTGADRFVPEDLLQEAVLVLLISEYIVTSEAILSRGADINSDRRRTFENTAAVYDLLCIALARRCAYAFLANSLEHALKFSYEEFHVWWQLALTLSSAGRHRRALLVLRECARMAPENVPVRLLAARICMDNLYQSQEGLAWAEAALVCAEKHRNIEDGLHARVLLMVAIGCLLRASESRALDERKEWMEKAKDCLERGLALDPDDHLLHYHRALVLAQQRDIAHALAAVFMALTLQPSHAASLHLLALLHTSRRHYLEADEVLCAALSEYPSHVNILLTKARLDAMREGPRVALTTYKRLLEVWKERYTGDSDSTVFVDRLRSRMSQIEGDIADRGSGSIRAESVAASRMEAALTELATSSVHSHAPDAVLDDSAYLQIQILLNLSGLYLDHGYVREAQDCIEDATAIARLYHPVLYARGRLCEARQELESAKLCYESAVALNPAHVKSLQRLGYLLHLFGEQQLAEKMLRDALAANPTASVTWQLLGDVLSCAGQEVNAAQCLQTAADLEQTEPIEPFIFLGRGLQTES